MFLTSIGSGLAYHKAPETTWVKWFAAICNTKASNQIKNKQTDKSVAKFSSMWFLEPGRVKTGLLKDIYDVPHLSRNMTVLGMYNSKALINRIHQNTHIATSTLLESKGSRIKIMPPPPPPTHTHFSLLLNQNGFCHRHSCKSHKNMYICESARERRRRDIKAINDSNISHNSTDLSGETMPW